MIRKFIYGLTLCLVWGIAQSPVRIVDGTSKEVIFGAVGRQYFSGEVAITNSLAAVITETVRVQLISCKTGATEATLTITNNEASEVTHWDAVAIAANTVVIGSYGSVGMPFTSGIKATASVNNAVKCHFVGVQ